VNGKRSGSLKPAVYCRINTTQKSALSSRLGSKPVTIWQCPTSKTALAKVPLVVEFVTEALRTGSEKVVVFAHHRDVIQALDERLGRFHPVQVVGGMSSLAKQRAIDEFQTNPSTRVFIGNIRAAGIGITLTAASQCVFAELSWVPAEISQAEDRLHRIGVQDNVLVQHLVLAGSLDAIMVRRLLAKQEVLDGVLSESPKHVDTPLAQDSEKVTDHQHPEG
jgi:SWI/SNF-related matrix-associated actin-dependent regulator of chromatin subfamily A-like protein 1